MTTTARAQNPYAMHSACLRKVGYATRGKARAAKRAMAQKHRTSTFKIYACPWCGCWHVAHRDSGASE